MNVTDFMGDAFTDIVPTTSSPSYLFSDILPPTTTTVAPNTESSDIRSWLTNLVLQVSLYCVQFLFIFIISTFMITYVFDL